MNDLFLLLHTLKYSVMAQSSKSREAHMGLASWWLTCPSFHSGNVSLLNYARHWGCQDVTRGQDESMHHSIVDEGSQPLAEEQAPRPTCRVTG